MAASRLSITRYCIVLVAALGAGLAAAVTLAGDLGDLRDIAPLLALSVAAEALSVRRVGHDENAFSFSTTAHVAAAILMGPVAAVAVAAGGVLLVDGLRLRPPLQVAINSAMFGLSILAGYAAFAVAGGVTGDVGANLGLPMAAMVGVRMAANSALYAATVAVATGRPFLPLAAEDLRENASTGVGEGSLGILLATSLADGRVVVLPYLLPLLAALYASRRNYERLKREAVDVLETLAEVIDERDESTARHSERVAGYVERFARGIGLEERPAARLVEAARYHDLGKIVVDEATLSKEGRLTPEELRAIRQHPRISARLLWPFHFAKEIALYAELHHERFDGRGYYAVPPPEIPVEAHVLIVADSFDAMTSKRSYRPALSAEAAAGELRSHAGSQFHPLVARAFAAIVLGEDVSEALTPSERAELRRQFAGVPLFHLPALRELAEPSMFAAVFGVASLGTAGAGAPLLVSLALAAGAAASIALWHRSTLGHRAARRRLAEALAAGTTPRAALAAAGVTGSVAWLEWDQERKVYAVRDDGWSSLPEADAPAILGKAARPTQAGLSAMPGGARLALSARLGNGDRVAAVLPRRCRASVLELIDAAAHAAPADGTREPGRAGDVEATPSLAIVRLHLFEPVRLAAGQLTAERIVAETADRLRDELSGAGTVSRHDDDSVRVALAAEAGAADRLAEAVEAAIARVVLPGGTSRGTVELLPVDSPA